MNKAHQQNRNLHIMLGENTLYGIITKQVKLFLPYKVNVVTGTHLVYDESVWLNISFAQQGFEESSYIIMCDNLWKILTQKKPAYGLM